MKWQILLLALSFGLVGCGESKPSDDSGSKEVASQKETDNEIKVNINSKAKNTNPSKKEDISNSKTDFSKDQSQDSKDDEPKIENETDQNKNDSQKIENQDKKESVVDKNQDKEKEDLFKVLEGEHINTVHEASPPITTSFEFGPDGTFKGQYFEQGTPATQEADLIEAANKYGTPTVHKSTYEGKIEYIEKIEEGIYKARLESLNITSNPGIESDHPFMKNVSWTGQVEEGDELLIFMDGAYYPFEKRAGTDMEMFFSPDPAYAGDVSPDEAYGLTIYNVSKDVVFNTWEY